MLAREISIRNLLFPEGSGIPDPIWWKVTSGLGLAAYLPNFPAEMQEAVKADLRKETDKLFKMSLLDVLMGGWKSYKDITQALEESRKNPAEPILKIVVDHKIKSVHHPYLELSLAEKPIAKIEFEVTAALDVNALALKIRNGSIVEIKSGWCAGNIKLAYQGETLTQVKLPRVELPGAIDLQDTTVPTKRLRGAASLVILSGPEIGQIHPIENGFVIGRTSGSDIRLSDPAVSRHHARLRLIEEHWHILDIESVDGVYVNGRLVRDAVLKNNDRILLGSTEFEFHE